MSVNTPADTLPALVADLRKSFNAGRTKPLAWRRAQLKALQRLLEENHKALVEAQVADFRTEHLSGMEVNDVLLSIRDMLESLDSFTAPRSAPVILASLPSTGRIVPEPYGVVVIFSAWNYPLNELFGPGVGAIGAGNCVVFKPSEVCVRTADLLAKLIPQYLDADCIRVVSGDSSVGQALLQEKFDYICYTGSTTVGKLVYQAAAKHLTPVLLELGGKSPTYVHKDASLDLAAARIAWAKYMNCGQTCIAPDYLLVHEAVRKPLLEKIKAKIKDFYGEDASKSEEYEKIVADRHFQRISRLIEGQTVFYGGHVDAATRYIEPTIVVDPSPESPVMQEEIFGPILPVIAVNSEDEALQFINGRPKPLALYMFSSSTAIQQRFLNETSSGAVVLNDCFMHSINPGLPFGGVGDSGMGVYHGKYSFETFSHLKPVLDATTIDPPVRYPPYTPAKKTILKTLINAPVEKITRVFGYVGVALIAVALYTMADRWKPLLRALLGL